MTPTKIYIYGKHAVIEALKNAPHAIEKVLIADYVKDPILEKLSKDAHIPYSPLTSKTMPDAVEESTHQGVIATLSTTKLLHSFDDFTEKLIVTPDSALVLLGELQDPQNVGAIIRSAAAFGISGILIPEHNQVQITGTVIKVSAGMAFKMSLVSVSNVNSAIRELKKRGFWVYGLEGEGKGNLHTEKFDAPSVFIPGNESSGVRQKTLELCDIVLSIPINPKCESLNVAASTSVVLYAWSAQHPKALKSFKK